MKNCKYCKKEFDPKNPKGKFCSDKCRVYSSRVAKSAAPIIHYTPPPIITSKVGIEKINAAFKEVFDSTLIEKQIETIRQELKYPPKNPSIGLKMWTLVREKQIIELQKQLK